MSLLTGRLAIAIHMCTKMPYPTKIYFMSGDLNTVGDPHNYILQWIYVQLSREVCIYYIPLISIDNYIN